MIIQTARSVHITAPQLPVARVFHQIRATDADRTSLQHDLGYSQAGITRHVAALIRAGLVEETRPDSATDTRSGRPRTKLGIDGRHLTARAAHIGVRSSELVICDLAGRVIRHRRIDHDVTLHSPEQTMSVVAGRLIELGAGLPDPVSTGIAFSAHVDRAGLVSSGVYGWDAVDVGALLPFEAVLGTGVAAMAGTEIINTALTPTHRQEPSTLYFYAREVISHAWIFNGAVHRPSSGRTPLAFGNSDTLREAARRGVHAGSFAELLRLSASEPAARTVLDERARALGSAVTAAVDVVDPDAVVLAGEAFTLDQRSLRIVVEQLRRATGSQLRIQRADAHILRTAAIQVALHPVRQDPLSVL